jgi:predicted enzyme related to lactoylglutathione lyase
MSNPIIHVEMVGNDHGELAAWYARHFGWTTQSFPELNYTSAATSDTPGTGVGFGTVSEGHPIGTIYCYIYTDNLDGTLAALLADGATILAPRMEVPTVGAMVWFRDPDGNPMALLQPEMTPQE